MAVYWKMNVNENNIDMFNKICGLFGPQKFYFAKITLFNAEESNKPKQVCALICTDFTVGNELVINEFMNGNEVFLQEDDWLDGPYHPPVGVSINYGREDVHEDYIRVTITQY